MNLHFAVRSIPELASLPEDRRQALWQHCHPKEWRNWQTWLALFVSMASYAGGFYLGVFAQSGASFSWGLGSVGLVLVFVSSAGFFQVHVAMTRRYIRQELGL